MNRLRALFNQVAPIVAGLELAAGTRAAFFAIPENHALPADLQRKHPGGSGGVMHRKSRPDQILFEYYLVTP